MPFHPGTLRHHWHRLLPRLFLDFVLGDDVKNEPDDLVRLAEKLSSGKHDGWTAYGEVGPYIQAATAGSTIITHAVTRPRTRVPRVSVYGPEMRRIVMCAMRDMHRAIMEPDGAGDHPCPTELELLNQLHLAFALSVWEVFRLALIRAERI